MKANSILAEIEKSQAKPRVGSSYYRMFFFTTATLAFLLSEALTDYHLQFYYACLVCLFGYIELLSINSKLGDRD